jgi:DNA polymerase III sliding clamp (beta) subunit (PCNA family)
MVKFPSAVIRELSKGNVSVVFAPASESLCIMGGHNGAYVRVMYGPAVLAEDGSEAVDLTGNSAGEIAEIIEIPSKLARQELVGPFSSFVPDPVYGGGEGELLSDDLIDGQFIVDMSQHMAEFASTDGARPSLVMPVVYFCDEGLVTVATDGYRVAVIATSDFWQQDTMSFKDAVPFYYPAKLIHALKPFSVLEFSASATYNKLFGSIVLMDKNHEMIRLSWTFERETFVPWKQVIPTYEEVWDISHVTNLQLKKVKKDHQVHIYPESVTVFDGVDVIELVGDQVDIDEDPEIRLNAKYVRGALKTLEALTTDAEYVADTESGLTPVIFSGYNGELHVYVLIVPLRK